MTTMSQKEEIMGPADRNSHHLRSTLAKKVRSDPAKASRFHYQCIWNTGARWIYSGDAISKTQHSGSSYRRNDSMYSMNKLQGKKKKREKQPIVWNVLPCFFIWWTLTHFLNQNLNVTSSVKLFLPSPGRTHYSLFCTLIVFCTNL